MNYKIWNNTILVEDEDDTKHKCIVFSHPPLVSNCQQQTIHDPFRQTHAWIKDSSPGGGDRDTGRLAGGHPSWG